MPAIVAGTSKSTAAVRNLATSRPDGPRCARYTWWKSTNCPRSGIVNNRAPEKASSTTASRFNNAWPMSVSSGTAQWAARKLPSASASSTVARMIANVWLVLQSACTRARVHNTSSPSTVKPDSAAIDTTSFSETLKDGNDAFSASAAGVKGSRTKKRSMVKNATARSMFAPAAKLFVKEIPNCPNK